MAIDLAIRAFAEVVAESESHEEYEEVEEGLQALFIFAVQSFLGAQMVTAPGALKDFRVIPRCPLSRRV